MYFLLDLNNFYVFRKLFQLPICRWKTEMSEIAVITNGSIRFERFCCSNVVYLSNLLSFPSILFDIIIQWHVILDTILWHDNRNNDVREYRKWDDTKHRLFSSKVSNNQIKQQWGRRNLLNIEFNCLSNIVVEMFSSPGWMVGCILYPPTIRIFFPLFIYQSVLTISVLENSALDKNLKQT